MRLRFTRSAWVGVLCFLAAAPMRGQRTLHVPGDAATVQGGIDAASAGDTVIVAAGTWTENLDFHGRAVTVQSADGAAATILDGGRVAPTVSFTTGEGRGSVLAGFTIRNGAPARGSATAHGAGVLLRAASPTLRANVLTDNLCAAIDGTDSAPVIDGNTVTRTHPDEGCVAQAIAPITLTGYAADGLVATLTGNTVEANDLTGTSVQPNAGAIALLDARAIVQGNTLRRNVTEGEAPGGIQVLANPTAAGTAPILIQQNLIFGNVTGCGAGGLSVGILNDGMTALPHVEVQILNNTVADNVTDPGCGGDTQASEVAVAAGSLAEQMVVANNVFAGGSGAGGSGHPALACSMGLAAAGFHHNLVDGPAGGSFGTGCVDSGANVLADPRFVDRAGEDFHLALLSPGVDAGSNAVSPMTAHDLDGAARVQNATEKPSAIIDLGPFEHPAPQGAGATTTVVNAAPAAAVAFQSVTFSVQVTAAGSLVPTGTVRLSAGMGMGAPVVLATIPLDATGRGSFTTSSLGAGAWTVMASFGGDAAAAASVSAALLETVEKAATILSFSVTPSDAGMTQTIALAAEASAPLSTRVPPGPVQFFDLPGAGGAGVLLGSGTLDATGHATLTLTAMAQGTHHISASYAGTADFAAVDLPAGDALLLTISAEDYAVTMAAPSLTVQTEHHGTLALTLTSLGSFAGTVSLACANLPEYASCSFAPGQAGLTAGASVGTALTIDTDAVPGFVSMARPGVDLSGRGGMAALAALFPAGLVGLLLVSPARRRKGLTLLCGIVSVAASVGLTGCGAGRYPGHTPPGTYTVQIVTQAASGTTHTATVTLVVTP